jgi:hypothetical protein
MGSHLADFSAKARQTLTTKEGFLRIIQTKETENMKKNEANGQGTWSNVDLDPTPPEQRNWSAWHFFAFQFSISFSPTTYNVGASLIAVGLSWWIILVLPVTSARTFRDRSLTETHSIILQLLDLSCAAWSCFSIHGPPQSEHRENFPVSWASISLRVVITSDSLYLHEYQPASMDLCSLSS